MQSPNMMHNSDGGLSLLPTEDRRRLSAWNATDATDLLTPASLVGLTAASCTANRDAIALIMGSNQVTYGTFEKAVDAVAAGLQRRGVSAESVVAIFMERSLEMVIAIHAVIRAGGAYCPVEPGYPPRRILELLDSARAVFVLTGSRWRDLLPAGHELPAANVDQLLAQPQQTLVQQPRDPNQAAYVICTSGSTGHPKGVVNTDIGLINRLRWMQRQYALCDDDVVLQKTSFSFDVSVWELFWPLLAGAKMVIAPPGQHRDPRALSSLIQTAAVTVCHFVPSFLNALLQVVDLGQCRSLRHVICSGEELPAPVARQISERLVARVHNLYGPTEAAIDVTHWDYEPIDDAERLPIGRPIANIQMHVLDSYFDPVLVEQTGELFISGVGLARGYAGKPSLTAAVFLPAALAGRSGERMYRTGDLGRWLTTGVIEFLGRADRQVKLRGVRIDLGEIESVLRSHPGIRTAAVALRARTGQRRRVIYADRPVEAANAISPRRPFLRGALVADEVPKNEFSLAAWIQPEHDTDATITVVDVRSWLGDRLPGHLVPSLWAIVPSMPLTESGKLDTKALPQPAAPTSADYLGPSTAVEIDLVAIWSEVLQVPPPSVLDNFFALGGDSLLALRVVASAAQRGIFFDVATMFASPTIRELGKHAVTNRPIETFSSVCPFALLASEDQAKIPPGVTDAYPLAHIQAGLIFHDEADARSEVYKEVFVYTVRGQFDEAVFRGALLWLVRRHEILRTSVDLERFASPMQLVHQDATALLNTDRVEDEQTDTAAAAVAAYERRIPFAWDAPPFARFKVRALPNNRFQIFLTFHDLLLDGWSASLLIIDLLRAYDRMLSGNTPVVTETPAVRFADYIKVEQAARDDSESAHYFATALQDLPATRFPINELATHDETRFAVLDVPIDAEISAGLNRVSLELAVNVKHVLLAAHVRVLSHLFGQCDVVTGLELNGRLEQAGGERVLGMHLNTVPLRLRLRSGSWRDLIQDVARAERELWPHRRYSYAKLQTNLGRHGLVNTVFNYVHFHVFHELAALRNIQLSDAGGYGASHFPFRAEFSMDPFSQRIHLSLECNIAELGEELVKRVGTCYQRALALIATAPDSLYCNPGLFTDALRQLAAIASRPANTWLRRLYRQAATNPCRVALTDGTQHVTFAALLARATTMADELRSHGVGPDVVVAIHLQRPLHEILSILAIHIAGGAYLPISSRLPPDGVGRVLQASSAAVLISDEVGTETPHSLPHITIQSLMQTTLVTHDRETAVDPASLAYVMYTSGSTGSPRGVMVSHDNLQQSLASRLACYATGEDEAFLLVPGCASDSSVAVIFWSLASGGRLIVRYANGEVECDEIESLIAFQAATTLLLTPTLYGVLLGESAVGSLASLRRVIVAGEVAHAAIAEAHNKLLPDTQILNEYGPTEAAVWSTVCANVPPDCASLPIGRACSHCHIRLLDEFLLPTMDGQAGEILIGGGGIARGYLADPAGTAALFVPDELARGGRAYRSGDIARLRSSGDLEFLGRRDRQVEVNGFRLELAEVENALLRCPGVQDAGVIAHGTLGRTVICAFVVSSRPGLSKDDVLRHLRKMLPRHAIPAECAVIARLPKTATSKVDYLRLSRQRLQILEQARLEQTLAQVEAMSDVEAQLALATYASAATRGVGEHDHVRH
jgi:amino acid adenylation domain-containing protein